MLCSRMMIGVGLVMGLAMVSSAGAAEPMPLKAGDRIVFLGDSITQGGAGPNGYITFFKQALDKQHPDLKVECIGAGISGNKVPNLQARVDKDVVAKQPTIVFVYIGINDVWHGEKDPARGTTPENFTAGLKEVIGKIKAGGARVILCTPSVIGEKKAGANPLDAKLDQYADLSRGLAKELDLQLCDLRKAFVEHIAANNPEDKEKGILTSDRVHLNLAGNQFVAETMLKMFAK
ncbi:MAG: SGNH/GDSL hydrolase family protein [Planctomycetaceae bacterium]|nr:SGNH/GDSL hydrolase family protein [Planctomycetaceae bacterium]